MAERTVKVELKLTKVEILQELAECRERIAQLHDEINAGSEDPTLQLKLSQEAQQLSSKMLTLTNMYGVDVDAHVSKMSDAFVAVAEGYSSMAEAFLAAFRAGR